MKAKIILAGVFLFCLHLSGFAQKEETKEINYTSERTSKNEEKYPGALLMYKVDQQVIFTHEDMKVWCDQAIFYKEDNFFRASGNVKMIQGDTITLTAGYAEYDGTTQFAFASNNVFLKSPSNTLTSDSLFFDRVKQEAFYRSGGTVRDDKSTITSGTGRYYMEQKKYSFTRDVVVTNDQYKINSEHLVFYPESGHAYLYGPTTISDPKSKLYCERGFYDTKRDYGYFVKNSRVHYEDREMHGDSLYYDRVHGFASATNNIKVIDTVNQSVARGHYAEAFMNKDSVFITKRALVSKKQEQDTIHIHGDTIMVTGKPEQRIIRAFRNAKFLKSDMNGKCDSIYSSETKGLTRLIGKPVVFSDWTQMTGDTIELFNNKETNKLDSLSVYDNAFLIQKDTIEGFNQVKGKYMYGLFKENNQLDVAYFVKNTETIYYTRDEKDGSLIGVSKAIASAIKIGFDDNEVSSIEYQEKPQNILYPPEDFPKNARLLRGFNWRGEEERILNKADLFKEDPPLELTKIKGIPLPEPDSFFDSGERDKPLLPHKKSRLTPEILSNQPDEGEVISPQLKEEISPEEQEK